MEYGAVILGVSGRRRWSNLQINVSQLLKSGIGTVRNYEADTAVIIEDGEIEFRGNVRLMRTDRGILVKGTLHSRLSLFCSRCLGGFDYPLTLNIEEEYYPSMDIVTGARLPSPEEPGSFTIDDRNILDMEEAVRQYTVLAVPIKPLCRQGCEGLCPVCGANLNETSCSCKAPVDPRWAELSKFKLVISDTESSVDN
jgi:uncharacterized protein